ncbi:MAG: MoaD/ThiS family protein [Candidatus Freyarchaeota archaeon]
MKVRVRVMSSLKYVAKRSRLSLEVNSGATVRTLLCSIREVDEKLFRAVLDHSGELNPGIIVLVNERDIDVLQELDTKLQDGDEVVLLSAVHGGMNF